MVNSKQCSNEMKRAQEMMYKKSLPRPAIEQTEDTTQNATLTPKPNVKEKAVSLSSPSPSRQKPISSRDDPLDRVQAFLTELPFLD